MDIRPIKTETEYEQALTRVDTLMEINPAEGSPENDELEVLVILIEKYEEKHWKIEEPDPVDAIKFRMEQLGLKQKDLIPYIGSKSKVSEVLNRKVELSLNMIKNLYEGLHLPLEVLIKGGSKAHN